MRRILSLERALNAIYLPATTSTSGQKRDLGVNTVQKPQQPTVPGHEADGTAGIVTPKERPAWAMSLVFHVAILVALYSITQVTYSGQDSTELDSLFQEFDAENYSFDSVVVETMGNQSDLNEPSPSQAASTSLSTTPQQEVQKRLDE